MAIHRCEILPRRPRPPPLEPLSERAVPWITHPSPPAGTEATPGAAAAKVRTGTLRLPPPGGTTGHRGTLTAAPLLRRGILTTVLPPDGEALLRRASMICRIPGDTTRGLPPMDLRLWDHRLPRVLRDHLHPTSTPSHLRDGGTIAPPPPTPTPKHPISGATINLPRETGTVDTPPSMGDSLLRRERPALQDLNGYDPSVPTTLRPRGTRRRRKRRR
mmetsp:Transcript_19364/g.56623  ORF Transcript_19364/g.56623 Transcript_19364/m.56623 type:complete len:217 (-) Transcript_19364:1897-2547(-)